ncbi:uncharacterized protein LOC134812224 isoform X3 [Bolinopsis microptera]|uniref:uncharacterized protein LOC134812224 isoform X3 n=1 Tax=Bolinopsis microptera TaxID=2820187 RepID=UPI00307AD4EA
MSLTPEIIAELVEKLGEKHIMLSYNWGVQDVVRTTYEYIESIGIPVWMDIKGGVSGNINAAMAKGVEGASMICPFMTEDYEASESCELELNYAKDRKVQIVPCMVQEQSKDGGQYRASGWLGVITAGKLWTDFRGLEDDEGRIAAQANALLLEIANKLNVDTRGGFKPVKPPPKPAAPKSTTPPPAAPKPTPPPAAAPKKQAPASSGGALKGKLGIKSHHGTFIGAPNSSATCSSKSLGGDETIEVVEIKANTVALKSKHGKYLSIQQNHSLQWNRDKAQGWEYFTVGWIDKNKFTLKSYHGKYLSAQGNGKLECNRSKADAWEHFTVTKPSASAASSGSLKNLALHSPHVYQSSVACGGDPKRAVDGNTNGVYNNKGVTHTDPNQDKGLAWWHVNLGAWYKVNSIKVWNRIECSERLNNAHVYVHKKYIGQVKLVQGQQMYEFPVHDYNTNSVTVCLIATKAPLSLAQVEVFGTGAKGPQLTNVALKKPCFQSSVAHGGDPNRAVDGVEHNLFNLGHTTHTDSNTDGKRAWWFVELGAKYLINEINILNRSMVV